MFHILYDLGTNCVRVKEASLFPLCSFYQFLVYVGYGSIGDSVTSL
jgi:hypothetical protein